MIAVDVWYRCTERFFFHMFRGRHCVPNNAIAYTRHSTKMRSLYVGDGANVPLIRRVDARPLVHVVTKSVWPVTDEGDDAHIVRVRDTTLPRDLQTLQHLGPFTSIILGECAPHVSVVSLLAPYGNRLVGTHFSDVSSTPGIPTLVAALHSNARVRARFDTFVYHASDGTRITSPRWVDFVRMVGGECHSVETWRRRQFYVF